VIEAVKPEGPLALIVGMANDKEHFAFAEQLLSGIVFLPTPSRTSDEMLTRSGARFKFEAEPRGLKRETHMRAPPFWLQVRGPTLCY
jgi:hypothetical protein